MSSGLSTIAGWAVLASLRNSHSQHRAVWARLTAMTLLYKRPEKPSGKCTQISTESRDRSKAC